MDIFEFMRGYKPPEGYVLFAKVWGSFSHNTQLPASDVDFSVVYAAPARKIMGIHDVVQSLHSEEKPDCQSHEVRKFAHLLAKGNPSIFEMLFTERMCFLTKPWQELVKERHRFRTQAVVRQYLGYANEQLKKLKAGKSIHAKGGVYGEKWAYHMIRILLDARRIAGNGDPVVWKEGWELDLLMEIRHEKKPYEEVIELAETLSDEIDSMSPWPLPEASDMDFLDDWVYRIRREEL